MAKKICTYENGLAYKKTDPFTSKVFLRDRRLLKQGTRWKRRPDGTTNVNRKIGVRRTVAAPKSYLQIIHFTGKQFEL